MFSKDYHKIFISQLAEGVGVEPTGRFLDGYGLANRSLDHLHTLP